jgi:hypothetical protein
MDQKKINNPAMICQAGAVHIALKTNEVPIAMLIAIVDVTTTSLMSLARRQIVSREFDADS